MSNPVDLTTATWRKSSLSGANGDCVEVADLGDVVAVRDSKNPGGPGLVFTRATWSAFVAGLKSDA
ncbi:MULTISPECIES: DUF397 domain-containing protein [unclassified Streptosporangium]|uniref:DUF397 domain-containing protein n=1 Tax=unclassified Streptosporangium TaxID=2632669 RepID=UPI002E29B88A|nr:MULTISPECIES: DUF397 domain-containing protein [unclassified Streptosporangium]